MDRRQFLKLTIIGTVIQAVASRARQIGLAGKGGANMLDITGLGNRLVTFSGGQSGEWEVIRLDPVKGESLPRVKRIARNSTSAESSHKEAITWALSGVTSNVRYVDREEKKQLAAKQAGLGRKEATLAALIPIKKTATWWDLTQDERRRIFEAHSHHTEEGLKYLPAIARQLYHCHDLGEPFDFLTWFEYSPEHSQDFEKLVRYLRGTEEWAYVEREVDIRLRRV